jgi:hypothetical protein
MESKREDPQAKPAVEAKPAAENEPLNPGRRTFLGKVSGVAAMAATAGSVVLEPLLGGKNSVAGASTMDYSSGLRARASHSYRANTARAEDLNVGVQPDNGDLAQFPDFSALYSKSLLHDSLGLPNAKSWRSFKKAMTSGSHPDFQNIIMGTPGGGPNSRLNGPQGGLAFDLEGLDSHATVIAPSPNVASAQTAAEAVVVRATADVGEVVQILYGSGRQRTRTVFRKRHISLCRNCCKRFFPWVAAAASS